MPYTNFTFVKLETALLDDYRFTDKLDDFQKGLLCMLLALAGKTKNQIFNDENYIKRALGIQKSPENLKKDIEKLMEVYPNAIKVKDEMLIFVNFAKRHKIYTYDGESGNKKEKNRKEIENNRKEIGTLDKDKDKDKILDKEIDNIYNFWNSLKIVIHEKISKEMTRQIKKLLDDGETVEEIKNTCENYSKILKDEKYYFKYKWGLDEFLPRGYRKFKSWEIAEQNFRSNKNGIQGNNGKNRTGFTENARGADYYAELDRIQQEQANKK